MIRSSSSLFSRLALSLTALAVTAGVVACGASTSSLQAAEASSAPVVSQSISPQPSSPQPSSPQPSSPQPSSAQPSNTQPSGAAPALANAAAAKKRSLVILPIAPADASLKDAAKALDELFLDRVAASGKYEPIGPADINAMIGVERLKDATGCTDSSCLADIGGALGADWVLSAQLSALGDQRVLSGRVFDSRRAQVLQRSSVRTGADAEAQAQGAASLLSELLQVPITAGKVVASAAPAPSYAAYQKAVTEFGRLMSNNDYSGLLTALDGYEKNPPLAPAGQDTKELITFYRVTSCYMLHRLDCVKQRAAEYQKAWPEGAYAAAVSNYVDQMETDELARESKQGELQKRLAELAQQLGAKQITADQHRELSGWAYFAANEFEKSAALFHEHTLAQKEEEPYLDGVNNAVMAYQRAGNFTAARALLAAAEKKYAKGYRLKNLHQLAKTLPK